MWLFRFLTEDLLNLDLLEEFNLSFFDILGVTEVTAGLLEGFRGEQIRNSSSLKSLFVDVGVHFAAAIRKIFPNFNLENAPWRERLLPTEDVFGIPKQSQSIESADTIRAVLETSFGLQKSNGRLTLSFAGFPNSTVFPAGDNLRQVFYGRNQMALSKSKTKRGKSNMVIRLNFSDQLL